jgi:DNA-binding MarR family transcriptional regulator
MSELNGAETLPLLIADIYEAAGALRQRGDRIAAAAGQTQARWQVLSVLSEGDWTVPKIARRLGVTRQAVQRTADQLSNDGMIEFERNPDHERSPLTRPTASGLAALAAMTAVASEWNELASTGLKRSDLEIVRAVLQALTTAARAEAHSRPTESRTVRALNRPVDEAGM